MNIKCIYQVQSDEFLSQTLPIFAFPIKIIIVHEVVKLVPVLVVLICCLNDNAELQFCNQTTGIINIYQAYSFHIVYLW